MHAFPFVGDVIADLEHVLDAAAGDTIAGPTVETAGSDLGVVTVQIAHHRGPSWLRFQQHRKAHPHHSWQRKYGFEPVGVGESATVRSGDEYSVWVRLHP